MAYIKRIRSEDESVVELTQQFTTVGRSENCDMRIANHHEISREHCGLRLYEDGVYTVADLGSKNGTCVNGERIYGETKLKNGDIVRLSSKVEFKFFTGNVGDAVEDPDSSPEEMTIADVVSPRTMRPKVAPEPPTAAELGKAVNEVEKELESADFKDLMAKFSRQAKPRPKRKPTAGEEEVW